MKWLRKSLKLVFVAATLLGLLALVLSYLSTVISPVDVPLLAFFGLGYPVILAFNLVNLILWLLRTSWWSLVVGLVLLAGLPIHSAFFQWNRSAHAPENSATLSVMSYNVELFGWYSWKSNIQRRNRFFEQLRQNPVDIYCFQEFFHSIENGRFDTRDTLRELLGTPHFFDHYTHEVHGVQFYGIATMSRYPIVNSGVIEFPNDKNNVCIYTDILVKDEIFRVYNGHLCSIRFSGDEHAYVSDLKSDPGQVEKTKVARMYRRLKLAFIKRAWQAELIRDHMQQSPFPVIFCGDFNDMPVSYAYNVFHRTLNDSFRERGRGIGNTYIGNFPSFRIDYIFASDRFKTLNHEVLPEELGDHHAVRVELELH